MKVYNTKTKKNQDLFESLIPTWTVGCTHDWLVNGDKGCAVYVNVSAETKEEAKDLALQNKEFMSHITDKKGLKKDSLVVFKPIGSYVIGEVSYYEGDPRL